MQTQEIKLSSFWRRGRAHVHGLLGSCKKLKWGLPYLSLLQHQKSEQYYKHDLISNFKAFWWQILSWVFWGRSEWMPLRTARPVFVTDKNVLYHLFLSAVSSRRLNIGKDHFRIIYPRRWHPSDCGNHHFVCFWRILSDISTSNRYAIQNSICSLQ